MIKGSWHSSGVIVSNQFFLIKHIRFSLNEGVLLPGINCWRELEKIPELKQYTEMLIMDEQDEKLGAHIALSHLIEKLKSGQLPDNQYRLLISFFGRFLEADSPVETLQTVMSELQSLAPHPMLISPSQPVPGGLGFEGTSKKKSCKRVWSKRLGKELECEFSPRKRPRQYKSKKPSAKKPLENSIGWKDDDMGKECTETPTLVQALLNGYERKIGKNESCK